MKMELPTLLLLVLATVQWTDGKFLGCYEDNAVRLLPDFHMYMDNVLSPARCIHICQQLQYPYAGVEYGIQCYCSNDKPYERMKRDIKECDMACPFSGETCGSGMRIAVYSVDSNINPITDMGTYIGCYLDIKNLRTLNHYQAYLMQINSPKRCSHVCTALGYMYAGIAADSVCFCGNESPAYDRKAQESECNVTCSNSEEKCGGNERISIYRTSVNSNAESIITVSDERLSRNALGCFEDSERRILSEYFTRLYDTNGPKNCLYLCQQYQFRYAGVEDGTDCYCGNSMPSPSRKRKDTECQTSCPNSTERCGGQMRIYVYSTQRFPLHFHSGLKTSNDNSSFVK